MERNLDRRVEVVFPVEDPEWAREIREDILPTYFRDTVNAWELGADRVYRRLEPPAGEPPFDAQAFFIERYRVPTDWTGGELRVRGMHQAPLPTGS